MIEEKNTNEPQNPAFLVGAVSGFNKKTSWRGEKCFHCETSNNTERMGVRINGSEEWKCFDCGRWFVLSEYSR